MRRLSRGAALAALGCGAPLLARAQNPAPTVPPVARAPVVRGLADSVPAALRGCTYARCALRSERVVFGERLLVGERGPVVHPRVFGVLPLDSVVRAVPEAVPYAVRYRREQARGAFLGLAGTVLGVVGAVRVLAAADDCSGSPAASDTCDARGLSATNTALLGGGLGLGLLGGWRLQIADRALNRAVFYYNAALPR